MIKTFCDSCDAEINESNPLICESTPSIIVAVKNKQSGGEKEFLVAPLSGGAEGDYCQQCVVTEIAKLDKRPTTFTE